MWLKPTKGGYEVRSPVIVVDPPTPAFLKAPPAPGGRTHLVGPGDTLGSIARTHYGSPGAWRRLAAANPGPLWPDGLRVGQVLSVPY